LGRCSKTVKLKGGFTVEARTARREYTCFYCRKSIQVGDPYVIVEGVKTSLVERYHVECFNRVMPHRLVARVEAGRVEVCRALEDDSTF